MIAPGHMMALGMFVFSLPTLAYQELQHQRSWRHARGGRIGRLDAVQFLGRDNEKITLSGEAPAELMDGRASLDQLAEMADQGAPWSLVDGTGRVFGAFVITALDETGRTFYQDGRPRLITFRLDLLEVAQPRATVEPG